MIPQNKKYFVHIIMENIENGDLRKYIKTLKYQQIIKIYNQLRSAI